MGYRGGEEVRVISILQAQSAAKSFLKASNKYLAKHPDWSSLNMPEDQTIIDATEEMMHQGHLLRRQAWIEAHSG